MPDFGCCRCCFSFVITCGLTALFLWLSLRTSKPTLSIDRFYVPSLAAATATNRSIYLDLKLANGNKDKGVHYANITLSLFYSGTNIANLTVPEFYQGHKKTARRRGLAAETSTVAPWAEEASNGTAARFTVRAATRVKYKIVFWYTKREGVEVAGEVEVNATTGEKVAKKGIKLKSGAAAPPLLLDWLGVVGPLLVFLVS